MALEICDYDVYGHYIFRGKKGIQTGRVSYYPDGKLIGLIKDEEGPQVDRLFLGFYNCLESSIVFLKLAPFGFSSLPQILYSLTSEKLNKSEKPSGTYLGFWNCCKVSLPEDFNFILSGKKVRFCKFLMELSAKDLEKELFYQENLEKMERSSQRRGFRGDLTFSER